MFIIHTFKTVIHTLRLAAGDWKFSLNIRTLSEYELTKYLSTTSDATDLQKF